MRAFSTALVLIAASAAQAQTDAPDAAQWRAWAVQDVEAATKIFASSHPGMFDPSNPGFRDQLSRAHDKAIEAAATVSGAPSYSRTLSVFSAGLRDGHAQAYSTDTFKTEWARMIAARRGDRTWIMYSQMPGVPKGAEVLACDGLAPDSYLKDHVFLTTGRPSEAGQWWQFTPSLFVRSAATISDRPSSCRFQFGNSAPFDVRLDWQPAPDNWGDMRRLATDGEKNPLTLSEPAPGIFHVGLSDFSPNAEGLKKWDLLLADLKKEDSKLRSARAIILDLRYNNGGSSNWPTLVAKQLWGEKPTQTAVEKYFAGVEIWWLADPGNIGRFQAREAELQKVGDKRSAEFVRKTLTNLKGAVGKGDRFYMERDPPGYVPPVVVAPQPLPPVYVMMPPSCASACLDAVDIFHLFPNVTLIGAPTSGDSAYLEVVEQALPSGHGKIVIPSKIWVGRHRAGGEVYTPKIVLTDLDWTKEAIVKAVETDLARQATRSN